MPEDEVKLWFAYVNDSGYIVDHKLLRGTVGDVRLYLDYVGRTWNFSLAEIVEVTSHSLEVFIKKKERIKEVVGERTKLDEEIKRLLEETK